MTVKQVEPLKFKGNKVYYLHKLSEKGADAIKCDFPNGDDTFTETTLQAAIDELAKNGGGGSAESLIPKRVIYINPDKETVAGECYPTFTAAKTYMETYPEQRFCVELPAGDFGTTADDHITLSEQWEIHGNKTKIVAPINSNVAMGQNLIVNPSGVFISDCTVSGGFVGYHLETDADFVYLPVYKLNHCRITEFCSDSETVDMFFSTCEYCEIETTRSHNELIAKGSQGSFPYIVLTLNSTIMQFGASEGTSIVGICSCIGNVGAYDARFVGCGQISKLIEEIPEININSLQIRNCDFQMKSNKVSMEKIIIDDSISVIMMDGAIGIDRFVARNSYINLRSDTTATITITNNWISPNTVFNTDADVIWSPTTDHTMCYIMYSTDGGTTMSNDPTGATHYGILKKLPDNEDYFTSYYMWFPMPA